jgi:hypothetical protein
MIVAFSSARLSEVEDASKREASLAADGVILKGGSPRDQGSY